MLLVGLHLREHLLQREVDALLRERGIEARSGENEAVFVLFVFPDIRALDEEILLVADVVFGPEREGKLLLSFLDGKDRVVRAVGVLDDLKKNAAIDRHGTKPPKMNKL